MRGVEKHRYASDVHIAHVRIHKPSQVMHSGERARKGISENGTRQMFKTRKGSRGEHENGQKERSPERGLLKL